VIERFKTNVASLQNKRSVAIHNSIMM
jgi:hypothetical protein